MDVNVMARRGRKSIYEELIEPRLDEIAWWMRNGATFQDVAKKLEVSLSTFNECRNDKEALKIALRHGREYADLAVENALFTRATGYEFDEITRELVDFIQIKGKKVYRSKELIVTKVVTKQIAPDVLAQMFWLKNRKPQVWRDKLDANEGREFNCNIKLPDDFPGSNAADLKPTHGTEEGANDD